jgi:methionyl-tRNA formyltransferase
MKIGVIGNTVITKKGIEVILALGHQVVYVFGLQPEKESAKVNFCDLTGLCSENKIDYVKSGNWEEIENTSADYIVCLGDSRIVPERLVEKYYVVGNHGAILPLVQGGASLVWGRMLNSGKWGVSLFKIEEGVDTGRVLRTREFLYEPDCSMTSFVEKSDALAIECLEDFLINGEGDSMPNKKWNIKVSKHLDSATVVQILKLVDEEDINIYLPPRTPSDSLVRDNWEDSFKKLFMVANNTPYPKWRKDN